MEWVCPECGVDYGTLHPPFAINTIKSFPRRFTEALAPEGDEDNDAIIRVKPAPDVWSALEYTAHVADLLPTFAEVIHRMNTEDNPTLDFWDQDERAKSQNYNGQAKDAVLADMASGAAALVAEAEKVDAKAWGRMAEFPWGARDMEVMLQNAAHEGVHHLKDAEKVLKEARSRA